jgi:V/A-type H+-transporting ATPase subunit B
MKDGIGEGYTRKDHPDLANQLFASYSKVKDIRDLAQIIGENDLSEVDKLYMKFGRDFEEKFIKQDRFESRTIDESLDLGWKILSILPKTELDRLSSEVIKENYIEK